jgi:tRNA-2-methylthio-N6-dimethylallyladenosine synthase
LQNRLSLESNRRDLGKTFRVLIEGDSKKSAADWMGRSGQNKVMVFPKEGSQVTKGDYVWVKAEECTTATLIGKVVDRESGPVIGRVAGEPEAGRGR